MTGGSDTRHGFYFAVYAVLRLWSVKYVIITIKGRTRPHRGHDSPERWRTLKALSIHPYYASAIVTGHKSVEVRTWKTDYRGDIVICSTNKKYHDTVPGHALGIVRLEDIVPFEKKHLDAALMLKNDYRPGLYAWILTDNRLIVPQPVKGKLSLWEYTGKIDLIPFDEWVTDTGADDSWIEKYWGHLMI